MRSMRLSSSALFPAGTVVADPVAPNCLAPGLISSLALNFRSWETVGFGPCFGPCPCKDQAGSSEQRMQQASLDMGRVVSLSSSGAVVSWSQPFAAPAGLERRKWGCWLACPGNSSMLEQVGEDTKKMSCCSQAWLED